jgi:hypothetical protein
MKVLNKITYYLSVCIAVFSFCLISNQANAQSVSQEIQTQETPFCKINTENYELSEIKQFTNGLNQYEGRITRIEYNESINEVSFHYNSTISTENIQEICLAYAIDFSDVVFINSHLEKL